MASAHTPGPWVIIQQKKPDGTLMIGIAPEGRLKRWVCRLTFQPGIPFEEEMANAHILSASLDTLAACKLALSSCDPHAEITHRIKAAIAKAEPEEG